MSKHHFFNSKRLNVGIFLFRSDVLKLNALSGPLKHPYLSSGFPYGQALTRPAGTLSHRRGEINLQIFPSPAQNLHYPKNDTGIYFVIIEI